MSTRVGVIADTHCPEFLDRIPDRVFDALQGVDLILHAGDVSGPETIAALERIAPVEAVRGDHDRDLPALPLIRELTIEGRRIVLVHGNRSRWVEEPQTLLWTLSLGYLHPNASLPRFLRQRFPDADAIVFGHTHRAIAEIHGGAVLFNPGAVHQWNPQSAKLRLASGPGWFEWCWLQVARHMRSYPRPSVGILEVSSAAIVPNVVEL
ncbi:MAG TPA: metallophosphoesterase family protein [Candidatus Acidoferrum sp.]|nr:metallophosphoesterase family protein [Candidatus Acidoferrum sp.]